jgi:hypothetical protein
MRNQLMVFQDQVKTINKSFEEGDEIIDQLGNETNQYMHASSYLYLKLIFLVIPNFSYNSIK